MLGADAMAHAAGPVFVEHRFVLHFRRVEEAALLIRPLLSGNGSVLLQGNTLTVRDTDAAAVERTVKAIAAYDVAPRAVSISVTLLKASNDALRPAGARTVSEEIRGVGERLKKLFNFTGYTPLDSVIVQGIEGEPVAYVIGGEYRIDFLLDSSGDAGLVRLKNLRLERLRREPSGQEIRREILKTSLNIPVGQTYVLGIGRDEAASGALFMVFFASWRAPGPGIVGVR